MGWSLKMLHPPFHKDTLAWSDESCKPEKLCTRLVILSGANNKTTINNNGKIRRYFLFQKNSRNMPPTKNPSHACLVKVNRRPKLIIPTLPSTQYSLGLRYNNLPKAAKPTIIKIPEKVEGALIVPTGLLANP